MPENPPNRVGEAILHPHTIQIGDDGSAGVYCDQVAEWTPLPPESPDTPIRFCMHCGRKLKRQRRPSPAMLP